MIDYSKHMGFLASEEDRSKLLDNNGRMKTQSLFEEAMSWTVRKNGYEPLYTLRDREIKGLPSAYLIYMNSVDEYEAAIKLVGSLRHWRKLCELKWFMEGDHAKGYDGLEQWRLDMMQRDASQAKNQLIKSIKNGDSAAAKRLLDLSTPKVERKQKGKATPVDAGRMERLAAAKKKKDNV